MARSPWHISAPLGAEIALALAFLASSGSAQQQAASTGTLEELAASSSPAVVLIDVQTPSDSRQGSGFLVDASGRILTNRHVIRDARSARVRLANGDVYEDVKVLAEDARRDIAVIQIAGFDLPYLPMGNSDSVRIGAPVVLIGSPLGLENTVSTGVVSGRRQEQGGFQLMQITAPASEGSSGGAVLAANGQVIGIAVSQIGAGQNLNFAVPINYARGLLTHLAAEPIAVLGPATSAPERAALPPAPGAVNTGFRYLLEGFGGYSVDTEAVTAEGRVRKTRITYRLIETFGGAEPRIERYLESETSQRTEPFGTHLPIRRERVRSIVHLDGLRPISSKGEIATWTGDTWRTASHDLRFVADRVLGAVTDTTGRSTQVDRTLPVGIILRDMRDLAFGTLDADNLLSMSVEMVTFDPWEGAVMDDRYDVRDTATVTVDGRANRALRVNVASGLMNTTVFFAVARPRILLRRESEDGTEAEIVTRLETFPAPPRK